METHWRLTASVGIVLLLTAIATLVGACFFFAIDVFLLVFLGVLFSVFLVNVSALIESWLPLGYGWCLSILLVSMFVLAAAGVFFFGIFIAVDPKLYRDGTVALFPTSSRERTQEIMDKMGEKMFHWLNGRFLAMFITGGGTGLGLWFLGVPLAGSIGVITALLTFIPNIGAIAALLLAMLMGLSQGPTTVLWVVILYCALQLVESNIVTPLVQQHQTSIPPALLISFQLLMGVMTGFLGVLVSTPLLAVIMLLVNEVWIKDTLGGAANVGQG